MQRIYLTMGTDEWAALVRAAGRNCRDPKQEARYLLRRALLGEQSGDSPPAPMKNGAVRLLADDNGAAPVATL